MSDIYSKQKRSQIMSIISGKETKPEIIVRKFLFSKGFRYRKNDNRYPGKPDIVLPLYKTVIFVHGCFWHQHPKCKYATWDEPVDQPCPECGKHFILKKRRIKENPTLYCSSDNCAYEEEADNPTPQE